ncbi:hypothetical protein CYMTET_28642 [Cymbomonas tetramitiformis]|uniref:UTP--glucose-1-phosphate uridylyltransferase n=1 Tax=Cymbomonas tetramitiformis TaxID=36881 RepID=A0AAE0FMJ2_9CHLO|nr:hypothetical protein CYMTET_28642 [Cymbomonas tetramitiformis]
MDLFEKKMKDDGLSDAAIAAFRLNYEGLVSGKSLFLPESTIEPIEEIPKLEDMKEPTDDALDKLLAKTAVCKLNGGLGTSMGLEKAKSLLTVKDGNTFLDLIALQVKHMRKTFKSHVRFLLMNSFSTSEDTKEFLSKDHGDILKEKDIELVQNKSPKVNAKTLEPALFPENPALEWCPPGHGDLYAALLGSGMLDRLLEDGIEYLFVSNSDNLGATMDLKLLEYFATSSKEFVMEVAERTAVDKKGGHLCKSKEDNKMLLREAAQCLDEDEKDFQDITKHKFFNTNNLWIRLSGLKKAMEKEGGLLPLALIKNSKTIDPRNKKTEKVFQLETAMGAAISCFDDSGAVVVPRTRFAPVKSCNDIFVLRSDAFEVTEDSRVVLKAPQTPVIKLDDDHYKMVDQMEALVEESPSLIQCKSLKVKGAVKFLKGVKIVGDVEIINSGKEENKEECYGFTRVVEGNRGDLPANNYGVALVSCCHLQI